jgi:hypothetical protein
MFKSHVETRRGLTQFCSLVVRLPNPYKGTISMSVRINTDVLNHCTMVARVVSQGPTDSDVGEGGSGGSSRMSTVLSSRFEELDNGWWKEGGDSKVMTVGLQSQGNA